MMLDSLIDAELVRQARAGSSRAFGALVTRYLRPALAVAWEFAPTREDAEDLVQDAFHRVLRSLDRFDERLPFRPWFFTILRNVGRNAAEKHTRWNTVAFPEDVPADEPDPGEAAHLAGLRDGIHEGLDILPAMQRTCFRLVDVEGFDGSEVAEMLGVSAATVRTHRHRARATLRYALQRLNEEKEA
ncbi:MAG: sigma-70 family RNA polymerase sigma factor [Gemmatimonadetes bacterium]|nr:sigma-70 family RNA polymerase sigma factor [Gemmatimonadota bacterium]